MTNAGEEKAKASINESLRNLQTEYVDLLLIHQPFGDYYGTYRAMEEAYRAGKARAIGVSNFYPDRFIDLAEHVKIKPAVNQVETHVFNQQVKAEEIMRRNGVDTTEHEALPFEEKDITPDTLILTMEKAQKRKIITEYGFHSNILLWVNISEKKRKWSPCTESLWRNMRNPIWSWKII